MLGILDHDKNGIIDINELQLFLTSLEEILSDCDLINMTSIMVASNLKVLFDLVFSQ